MSTRTAIMRPGQSHPVAYRRLPTPPRQGEFIDLGDNFSEFYVVDQVIWVVPVSGEVDAICSCTPVKKPPAKSHN